MTFIQRRSRRAHGCTNDSPCEGEMGWLNPGAAEELNSTPLKSLQSRLVAIPNRMIVLGCGSQGFCIPQVLC